MQVDANSLSAIYGVIASILTSAVGIGVVKKTVDRLEKESLDNETRFVTNEVFRATIEPVKDDVKEIKQDVKELLKRKGH